MASTHHRIVLHLVFATKFRQAYLTDDLYPYLYGVMRNITEEWGGLLIALGGIEDHVHVLIALPPRVAISSYMSALKSRSTSALRERFTRLKAFAWQTGYGVFSVNPNDMRGIIFYIHNQREHHARGTLRPALEQIEDTPDYPSLPPNP